MPIAPPRRRRSIRSSTRSAHGYTAAGRNVEHVSSPQRTDNKKADEMLRQSANAVHTLGVPKTPNDMQQSTTPKRPSTLLSKALTIDEVGMCDFQRLFLTHLCQLH